MMRILFAKPGDSSGDTALRALKEGHTHIWHNETLYRVDVLIDEVPIAISAELGPSLKAAHWQTRSIEVVD